MESLTQQNVIFGQLDLYIIKCSMEKVNINSTAPWTARSPIELVHNINNKKL